MKKKGNIDKFYYYSFPQQAVLVTCKDTRDKTNVITIAWHTTLSKKPPLYGISVAPSRFSHELIENSREFVVNFTPIKFVEKVNICGIYSGRNTDKINKTGFNLESSECVKTPFLKESFAHLECSLHETISLGDHTFFVGKVEKAIISDDAFESDLIKNKLVKPCYYRGGNSYCTIGDEVFDF